VGGPVVGEVLQGAEGLRPLPERRVHRPDPYEGRIEGIIVGPLRSRRKDGVKGAEIMGDFKKAKIGNIFIVSLENENKSLIFTPIVHSSNFESKKTVLCRVLITGKRIKAQYEIFGA